MDPYSVGYLTGYMLAGATIGYVVGRMIAGRSGISKVERITRLAEANARPLSRRRGVVPYVFAICGALAGLVSGPGSLARDRGATAYDLAKAEREFLSGCARGCVDSTGDVRACREHCACVFDGVKRNRGSAESLGSLLQSMVAEDPAAKREFAAAQSRCLAGRPVSM
jgi:hypothetical protein